MPVSPRVSVIVPLYNKTASVLLSLESIAQQSFQDLEVLVVDDGSTDDSAAKVAGFTDPRVRLIRQANAGPGAARNRGLAEARGEFCAFLDADDTWMPDYLERAAAVLDRNPEAAAIAQAFQYEPGSQPALPRYLREGLSTGLWRISAQTPAALLNTMVIFMWPCSTVLRTAAARRLGGFYDRDRCRYGEDAYLFLKTALNYPVYFWLERPAATFYRNRSELSGNLQAARPVEPFLLHPDGIREQCPEPLADLLEQFFSLRAMKTACMLAYWSRWREAKQLRTTFQHPRSPEQKLYYASWAGATPLGAAAGAVVRSIRKLL